MAPQTIAICKHPEGIDPISPLLHRVNDDFSESKIPSPNNTKTRNTRFLSGKSSTSSKQGKELEDLKHKYQETNVQMEEMKRQKNENSKRLLEMSGLVNSLHGIPVEYDKTAEGNNFVNVQRKIEAITYEMNEAKKRYDELKDTKAFQSNTIRSQDVQIRDMDGQIKLLNERLQKEELEQKEKQSKAVEQQRQVITSTEELEQQVMLQEMEMMNLTAEIELLRQKKTSAIGDKIKEEEANNAAKYAKLQQMEEQLASMQKDQEAFKIEKTTIVEKQKHAEEQQSDFVVKPTLETYAEITKLQNNIANLRCLQQEAIRASETADKPKSLPQQKPKTSLSKSQPWSQDLKQREGICTKKIELEIVANNDIVAVGDYEKPVEDSQSKEQKLLSLPSLEDRSQSATSVSEKKETASTDRSVVSANSKSLGLIDEESENDEPVEKEEENKNNEPVEIKKTKTLDSNSDSSATGNTSSTSSVSSKVSSVSANNVEVEIMQTDDGSIEAISFTRPEVKNSPSQESEESSDSEFSHRDSLGESSGTSSSGHFSSDASTQSSSRSILEQIPEEAETDDSDAESQGTESVVDQETKELEAGSLILRMQLKESESKYDKLLVDHKLMVLKSQVRMEKLQQENQALRDGKGTTLKSMADASEEEKKLCRLKQENKMLFQSMEKQNKILDKANMNYKKLQNDHSTTLVLLEEKNKRYDQLILDFSNLAGTGKNSEDYNRLRALHETVVLTLADMGEDNDRLEKERDFAIDQLEKKDARIRAYDETIASLNKTEYDLKMLQNVHGETIVELQQLSDKNKELQALYDKDVSSAEDTDKIKQDYVKAKTELEMLTASNKDFSGVQKKLNASEVKVAMLEDEDKKLKKKLDITKQKSKTQRDQLKDVISQYKTLKAEYSDKCSELDQIKLAAAGLDTEEGIKEMQNLTDSLQKAKTNAQEEKKGRKARENDLKIVLQHYEKLQLKYEKIRLKQDSKSYDDSSNGSRSQPFDEEKKEGDSVSIEDEVKNLEKLLKESKESVTWKDDKIAQTLTELKTAKEEIPKLEAEKEALQVELSEVKSKFLLAQKETDNAEEKQGSDQFRLRTAVTKHHQLQQVYDSLLKKFGDARSELQKVKDDIKVKEQEEKHARKRATTVHTQYKKLQEDHDVVVQRLEKLKEEMGTNYDPAEC